jgi:DNA-binding response OmpR family regulator
MAGRARKILWVDDEVDLLRPHVLFLGEHGFDVTPVSNGDDAVQLLKQQDFDLVLLDEIMPGRDGLSTLFLIRERRPALPVVMVTKSEAEELMNSALAQRIDDFLLKPLHPRQVLSTCKRILEGSHRAQEQRSHDYLQEYREFQNRRQQADSWQDWTDLHLWLSEWDLELERLGEKDLHANHLAEKTETDRLFGRYIEASYPRWVGGESGPVLSPGCVAQHVFPLVREGRRVCLVVMDCMRLDQWLTLEPLLREYYDVRREYYYSILPSATPYSRNAIFSGLFPLELARQHPEYWERSARDEGSKNRYERQLLDRQLARHRLHPEPEPRYVKILNAVEALDVRRNLPAYSRSSLLSLVINFMDMFIHSRFESPVLQEMTPDEPAFRSLTTSWFSHSVIFDILQQLSRQGSTVVLTSDHGSIQGRKAALIRGDRDTSPSLRYKFGTGLSVDERQALVILDPATYGLPAEVRGERYIIAKEDYYFIYPSRPAEYRRQYRGTFLHGGVSLDEMVLPVAVMTPKR